LNDDHEADFSSLIVLKCFNGCILPSQILQMSSRLQLNVRNLSLGMRHLVNANEVEAGMV